MAEIYRKHYTNLRYRADRSPEESFEISARSQTRIKLDDIKQVVDALVADLAQVQPPIEGDVSDQITIVTERDFGYMASHIVRAQFERSDATSVNADALGYVLQGYDIPVAIGSAIS